MMIRALLLILVLCPPAYAEKIGFTVEPIVGYERVQKFTPTAHTVDRLFYGARGSIGLALIAGEGEYTRGQDTENFTNPTLTIKESAEKFKVGARSSLGMTRLLSLIVRGGVQGVKSTVERTEAGVTTTAADPKFRYDPYAGLGFRFGLTPKMFFSASITAVMPEFPDMSKNEYQTSAGYQISFP
jgi:hypothetical protein